MSGHLGQSVACVILTFAGIAFPSFRISVTIGDCFEDRLQHGQLGVDAASTARRTSGPRKAGASGSTDHARCGSHAWVSIRLTGVVVVQLHPPRANAPDLTMCQIATAEFGDYT
jgi:hypothetical protein